MSLSSNDSARAVMHRAHEEAARLNHEYVGTEHILLGLVREKQGIHADIFATLGVEPARIYTEVAQLVMPGPEDLYRFGRTFGRVPLTPRAIGAIGLADAEAKQLGHCYVGSEHLLLGLIREHEGIAAFVLLNLGLTADMIRNEVTTRFRFTIDPQVMWQSFAVMKIARSIAETSRWEELPILADALEEAGCTQQELLRHLRVPAGHTTHCSILKTMLGT